MTAKAPNPYGLGPDENAPRQTSTQRRLANTVSTITTPRPCSNCSYDLKGLETKSVCPECGSPIIPPSEQGRTAKRAVMVYDRLSDAPRPYIRLIYAAFICLAMGLTGIIIANIAPVFFTSDKAIKYAAYAGAAFAAAWALGAVALIIPRPHRPNAKRNLNEWIILRAVTVLTQPGWFISMIFAIRRSPDVYADIASMVALFGTPAALLLMSKFAEWAEDEDSARRFRIAATLLVTLFLIYLVAYLTAVTGIGGGFFGILIIIGFLFYLATIVAIYILILRSLLNMMSDVSWAVRHSHRVEQSEADFRERTKQQRAQENQKAQDNQPFGGPLQ